MLCPESILDRGGIRKLVAVGMLHAEGLSILAREGGEEGNMGGRRHVEFCIF